MFINLEAYELMDRDEGFFIGSRNHHPPSSWGLLEGVVDFLSQPLHLWYSRRHRIVDEHGNIEVSARKRLRDVREVHTNVVTICGIGGAVGFDLYNGSVSLQEKVVCSGSLGKTHPLLAPLVHSRMGIVHRARRFGILRFRLWLIRRLLSNCRNN